MHLRHATPADLPTLLDIHNDAVRSLRAIWTDRLDTLEDRKAWFETRTQAGLPVIVAETEDGKVVGYGSYGPYRPKEGYRLTMEHSVYVTRQARGTGAGTALLAKLIEQAREDGYHVLIGSVEAENTASVALHRKLGFEIAGRLPQVGMKFGEWLDLYLMTLVLDGRPMPGLVQDAQAEPAGMPAVSLSPADPGHPDAVTLMGGLSDVLQKITGDSGQNSFDPDDVRSAGSHFVIARDPAGNPLGCGAYRPNQPGIAELKRMYAVPESKGVGLAILRYLEQQAGSDGYEAIRLETRLVNDRAIQFYERNGYARIPNFGKYAGRPEAVCFEKRLI